MSEPKAGQVKVCVVLREPVGSLEREWLWAEPRGGGLYQLWNVPFFAYNLHIADVVRCVPDPEGRLVVVDVVERSGAETLRVHFAESASDDDISALFDAVGERDGLVESSDRRFRAIALRTTADYHDVARLLQEMQHRGVVEWFESGYQPDEPFADQPTRRSG